MKIDIEVVGLARFDIDVVVKALVVTRGSDKRVSFRVQHCQYSSTTNVVRAVLALYVFLKMIEIGLPTEPTTPGSRVFMLVIDYPTCAWDLDPCVYNRFQTTVRVIFGAQPDC